MAKKIVTTDDIGGSTIKDNSTYLLEDNRLLNNLVLSKTTLHTGKETTGHSHSGVEELYFLILELEEFKSETITFQSKKEILPSFLMVNFIRSLMMEKKILFLLVYFKPIKDKEEVIKYEN